MNYKLTLLACLLLLNAAHASPVNLIPPGSNVILVSSDEAFKYYGDDTISERLAIRMREKLCAHFDLKPLRWTPTKLPDTLTSSVGRTPQTYHAKQVKFASEGLIFEEGTFPLRDLRPGYPNTPISYIECFAYMLTVSMTVVSFSKLHQPPDSEVRMIRTTAAGIFGTGLLTSFYRWYSSDYPKQPSTPYALPVLASELWCE